VTAVTTPDDDGRRDEAPADPPSMVPFTEWSARQAAPAEARQDDAAAGRDAACQAGRATGMACAAAHALPFGLAVWITGATTASSARNHFVQQWAASANPRTPPPYGWWLLAIGGVCWLVCTVAELVYAHRLGGGYPARGPWARLPVSPVLSGVRRATAGLDRKLGAGGGCLGLLALAVLGPAVVLTWSVFTAYAAPLWVVLVGAAALVHLATVSPVRGVREVSPEVPD
jgi:hypothetical protein